VPSASIGGRVPCRAGKCLKLAANSINIEHSRVGNVDKSINDILLAPFSPYRLLHNTVIYGAVDTKSLEHKGFGG